MKLLALSDIHDNLAAVRALRAAETNSFDAIVVAGDIGNKTASGFFEILATFGCPVVHVYGNWDDELGYEEAFGSRSSLLHMNIVQAGAMAFTGFSGCPAHWGRNPIALRMRAEVEEAHRNALGAYAEAAEQVWLTRHDKKAHDKALAARVKVMRSSEYQEYREQSRRLKEEIFAQNRQGLIDNIRQSGADPRRLVLVTHERLYRLPDDLPGIPLHLFGHQHGFSDKSSGGTKFVNVSILDHVVTLRPRAKELWSPDDCRETQAGNYAVIEIDAAGEIAAHCVHLPHPGDAWVPAAGVSQKTPSPLEG